MGIMATHFIKIGNSTENTVYQMSPTVPYEDSEGISEFWKEEMNELMGTLLGYLQSQDSSLEFMQWWIQDDHGNVLETHDTLTQKV